eukprot:scaffold5581_cov229-Prasinococcus_capsulatus_cf.AAC.8
MHIDSISARIGFGDCTGDVRRSSAPSPRGQLRRCTACTVACPPTRHMGRTLRREMRRRCHFPQKYVRTFVSGVSPPKASGGTYSFSARTLRGDAVLRRCPRTRTIPVAARPVLSKSGRFGAAQPAYMPAVAGAQSRGRGGVDAATHRGVAAVGAVRPDVACIPLSPALSAASASMAVSCTLSVPSGRSLGLRDSLRQRTRPSLRCAAGRALPSAIRTGPWAKTKPQPDERRAHLGRGRRHCCARTARGGAASRLACGKLDHAQSIRSVSEGAFSVAAPALRVRVSTPVTAASATRVGVLAGG